MELEKYQSIPEAFFAHAAANPDERAYLQVNRDKEATLVGTNNLESATRVKKIFAYLSSLGIKKGERIAILSNTRPEWMEADLAILCCGAISVSIYHSLPTSDVAYILYNSEAKVIFAENQEQVNKLLNINENTFSFPATEDSPAQEVNLKLTRIITFEAIENNSLSINLNHILENGEEKLFEPSSINQNDIAALVYTSGTTGPAKGVIQTHLNHLANVRQSFESGIVEESSTLTLFLPLAHSFAKLMGYIGFLTPAIINFVSVASKTSSRLSPNLVTKDIVFINAQVVPIVPRFLEKMKDGVINQSLKDNLKAKFLRMTISAAKKVFEGKNKASIFSQIVFRGTKEVRNKIREQLFGSNFKYCVSGGAKLSVDVAEFFQSLELTIYEGYGLTETCVATNVNRRGAHKIGTVGPVLSDDIEIKIAEDGEILFRGPNISKGYFNRPTATKSSWDEQNWFHTGDTGSIDEDGFLQIIGRKKEIIVTSGGKKIAPLPIEDKVKALPLVSNCLLVGDNRPFCVCLITLEPEAFHDWVTAHSLTHGEEIYQNEKLKAYLNDQIDTINAKLSSFETIKNFLILKNDFTVENGMLTPTFKTKRKAIETSYSKEINELYAQTKKDNSF